MALLTIEPGRAPPRPHGHAPAALPPTPWTRHAAAAERPAATGARVVVEVATQPYLPRPDEIPAEWAARRLARAPAPGDAPPAPAMPFLPQLAEGINAFRHRQGLPPLAIDAGLDDLAERHSRAMASVHRLSHEGFRERLVHTGSRLCVENVAQGFRSADGVLQGWQASAGHLRNLLEPEVRRMGLAEHERYVTLFACR